MWVGCRIASGVTADKGGAVQKAGVVAVWLGFILTLLGLISGFSLLFLEHDELALLFMSAVPFGFLFLFAGLVVTQFGQAG